MNEDLEVCMRWSMPWTEVEDAHTHTRVLVPTRYLELDPDSSAAVLNVDYKCETAEPRHNANLTQKQRVTVISHQPITSYLVRSRTTGQVGVFPATHTARIIDGILASETNAAARFSFDIAGSVGPGGAGTRGRRPKRATVGPHSLMEDRRFCSEPMLWPLSHNGLATQKQQHHTSSPSTAAASAMAAAALAASATNQGQEHNSEQQQQHTTVQGRAGGHDLLRQPMCRRRAISSPLQPSLPLSAGALVAGDWFSSGTASLRASPKLQPRRGSGGNNGAGGVAAASSGSCPRGRSSARGSLPQSDKAPLGPDGSLGTPPSLPSGRSSPLTLPQSRRASLPLTADWAAGTIMAAGCALTCRASQTLCDAHLEDGEQVRFVEGKDRCVLVALLRPQPPPPPLPQRSPAHRRASAPIARSISPLQYRTRTTSVNSRQRSRGKSLPPILDASSSSASLGSSFPAASASIQEEEDKATPTGSADMSSKSSSTVSASSSLQNLQTLQTPAVGAAASERHGGQQGASPTQQPAERNDRLVLLPALPGGNSGPWSDFADVGHTLVADEDALQRRLLAVAGNHKRGPCFSMPARFLNPRLLPAPPKPTRRQRPIRSRRDNDADSQDKDDEGKEGALVGAEPEDTSPEPCSQQLKISFATSHATGAGTFK